MLDMSNENKSAIRTDIDLSSLLSEPDKGVWEMIFDSLPEMVALIDLNNIIVKANKAMRLKLNVGDQGIVGHSCFNLMHENGCAAENCPHLSMIQDRSPHSIELYEPKFECFLNFTTTPIFDSNDVLLGSLHIVRDISDQKEAELKLRQYNNELRELNLGKDKFFSIVAHDLRSPFQGMLGFSDLILDEMDTLSREEIKEYLQKVRDSAYSTFSLLENLLNWSKLQTGKLQFNPSNFSISDDVAAIISLLESNAMSKSMTLINNIGVDFLVFGDQQMVHSILLNLVTNAIKFTFPGGTIVIDAKIKPRCDDVKDGISSCMHTCLEISVKDSGVGMSPSIMNILMSGGDHFTHSGTSNEQGAGLGLILVKEMAEKHGSKLSIISEVGKGSVFSFTLPLAEI